MSVRTEALPGKLLFASLNSGKFKEVSAFLTAPDLEIVSPKIIGASPPDVEENADSYRGNALLKARAFYNWAAMPVLADDTGLEVAALSGAPGVRSARYAGEKASAEENKSKLLSALSGVPLEKRGAKFVCVLCLKWQNEGEDFYLGELPGHVAEAEVGAGGFGYDSIFVPEGEVKTLAELKSINHLYPTHRIKALDEVRRGLSKFASNK